MKNKIVKRKLELTIIFLTFTFIAMMKIITMTVSPVSAENEVYNIPSLFYNDRAFERDETYPLYQGDDGVYYIPLQLLDRINDLKRDTRDNYTEDFYIQYNNNAIIFKVSADRAKSSKFIDDPDNYRTCKVYIIRGITYVPAQLVAYALGLTVEIRDTPQYKTLRIKNKDAKRDFDEMIESRIKPLFVPPTEPPVTAPPPPPVTTAPPEEIPTAPPVFTSPPAAPVETETTETIHTPPVRTTEPPTPEPTTPENTREIENYLMFYDSKKEKTDEKEKTNKINEVLKILDISEIKAVFFLSGSEIIENPDILRKIYASGHELGIKFENGRINFDAEDLISELESANGLIYSALKHKTRFCMFDETINTNTSTSTSTSTESGVFGADADGKSYEKKLMEKGYYLCEKTSDIPGLGDISNSDEMIEYMKQNTLNVFMFDLNGGYKNYLQLSAQAAETKFYINFSYINNANIKKIKDRIKIINIQEQTTES